MAAAHSIVRGLAETHSDVSEILRLANSALAKQTEDDRFVTLLLGSLDPASRSFACANAGHPPGYLIDGRGELRASFPSTGLPLGVVADASFPQSKPVKLRPGDVLLLFTDGIYEVTARDGDRFGTARTLEVLRRHRNESARDITRHLHRAIGDFSAQVPLADDVTVVVVKAL